MIKENKYYSLKKEGENDKIKTASLNSLRKIFKYFIFQNKILEFEGIQSISCKPRQPQTNDEKFEDYKIFLHKKFNVFLEILKGYILSNSKIKNLQVKLLFTKFLIIFKNF